MTFLSEYESGTVFVFAWSLDMVKSECARIGYSYDDVKIQRRECDLGEYYQAVKR